MRLSLQVNNNSYAKDHNELTALHQAGLGGHLDCVQILLRFDAPVDTKDKVRDWKACAHVRDRILVRMSKW